MDVDIHLLERFGAGLDRESLKHSAIPAQLIGAHPMPVSLRTNVLVGKGPYKTAVAAILCISALSKESKLPLFR